MRGNMAKDHYISQTYLKHFGDPTRQGRLNAYRKSDGLEFRCWAKNVCHEWDGDLNPAWLKLRPELLGDLRASFEQQWNPAIDSLESGAVDARAKFAIAGLFANMVACTPTSRRLATRMYDLHAVKYLSFAKRMREMYGYDDKFPIEVIEAIEMLERGDIVLKTNPDYVKAVVTMQILEAAWIVYNQNWKVLRNESDIPFITSDNPVAFIDPGGPSSALIRLLPITPAVCLSVRPERRDLPPFDANLPPQGTVEFERVKTREVKTINRHIAQCAEELVFSPIKSVGIAKLVKKWAKYGVDVEIVELPVPGERDTLYHASVIRVCERHTTQT